MSGGCSFMDEREEEKDQGAWFFAMEIASGSVLAMAVKSAIKLDLSELIKKGGEEGASASELASQLPVTDPGAAAEMIDRILRLLAAHSVLACSLQTLPDGGVRRRYSLTAMSKFITRNERGWGFYCMYHLKDAILGGGVPFDRALNMHAFEYPATDPKFNKVFNEAMHQQSTIFMKR